MTKKLMTLLLACFMMLLYSCDPLSEYYFRVHNMTRDTVSLQMCERPSSGGYIYLGCINDSSVNVNGGDTVIMTLLQGDVLEIITGIETTQVPPLGEITPLWQSILNIKIGDVELDPEVWNHESAWKRKHDGHGIFFGETVYFDLWLDESMK